MKKISIKLCSAVLLVALTVLHFSSCDFVFGQRDTGNTTNDSGGKTEASQGNNSDDNIYNALELKSDDELIASLIEYLQQMLTEHNIISYSTSDKINSIKNGVQPLLLDFTSSSSYFVASYYNIQHYYEIGCNCCADKYTWVRFDTLETIPEEYKGQNLLYIFQIDEASLVKNILSDDAILPSVSHFHLYRLPNGNGIIDPPDYEKTFIYLNSSNDDNIYYTSGIYYHRLITLPCIYFEDNYYLYFWLHSIYSDGSRSDYDLVWEFGEYYEAVFDIMIVDKYSVTNKSGSTAYYGLIDICDFAKVIMNNE